MTDHQDCKAAYVPGPHGFTNAEVAEVFDANEAMGREIVRLRRALLQIVSQDFRGFDRCRDIAREALNAPEATP